MSIRVLHTGDLHIGSFPGPEKNGENARYRDICNCLDALVAGAREQRPDIAVIAGDIFHQARVWSDRGLKEQQTAVKFLRELSEVCPVVVMRGTPNHDSEQQFEMLKTAFEGDRNVFIVTEPKVGGYYTKSDHSGSYIQIACLPGFDRGYYRAQHPGLSKEEENEVFTRAIEDMIMGLKAQCDAGSPTVLVSHFTVTGCNMESGQTAFFSQFEPVVYPSTLQASDFDLVCFGHIHRPQKLDGCRNAYYCGAISALNFNDEGQERGYWIHDIVEDTRMVRSEFHELPTRQYLTIRLTDEEVQAINDGDDSVLPPLEATTGKVIRVLYDCTDEHNKAFNHAVLENWLYSNGGAFWVQEITPQKISITVDRKSMDAEGTPEDNLGSYLAEKDFTPERIGELVELARPLIAEATEKATQERHTGLFVPMEIEVKNYRNYREEHFSYDGIRFCTINGQNGVGKSSLFMDAMLDCLYEEPREGELTGWICNDPEARSGAIKFTFQLGERTYRVTRTRAKSGKATLNIAELVDGEWTDRSKEKFRDTQQEIINILGIDSLTLKACALIMQDQYGLFLQADKEARMSILGSILGLGIYEDMEELAADRATDTNRTIRSLADRADTILAGLPDGAELAAQIEDAEARRKGLEQAAQDKAAAVDSLKVKLNTQLEAAGRVLKLNSKLSTLTATRATKEQLKTTQVGLITAADTILAAEPEIMAGVAEYNRLLDREKELIKSKAEYDSLTARKKQVQDALVLAVNSADEMRKKKVAITLAKIEPLQAALARAEELAQRHEEYTATAARIEELEAIRPEWEQKKATAQEAAEALLALNREHEKQAERLHSRVVQLEDKVELLADSECPFIEGASGEVSCTFLRDALKAQEELPQARAALDEENESYADRRRAASDAVLLAQEALDGCLYHPEEIYALQASLRSLEAEEMEYRNLAAQRAELEAYTERAKELDGSIADAEATAERGRAALAEVEQQMQQLAGDLGAYSALQTALAQARSWLDKERQLPVAREKKAAAATRLLEVDGEIEAVDAEIADTQAELAEERSKTVGREELQAQVDAAEAEIRDLQEQARRAAMTLGGLRKQAEQAEKSREAAAELQEQMNALAGKAAGYEELKKAFSQDGIPHNIIRSIIPVFEATATNILGQMSGGKMSVEFVTEKVLKSNSKKEVTTLDIIINDSDTGRLPYMSRSGGERVKAALSVILALSEIKSSKAGVQLGFLFIDEPPFLDAPGVQAYCDALEAIQQRYSDLKVMAITHDPAMKSRFPQSVDVVKTPEGSKVIYE